MYCEKRKKNGIVILECFGRFDEADTNQFVQILEQLQCQGLKDIIVNLSPVYYFDPKVLDLLIFTQQFIQTNGGKLSIISPLSSVRNVLIQGKIPASIPTFESVYDAIHRPHAAYTEYSA
jgi:anti-anti-sigma factor